MKKDLKRNSKILKNSPIYESVRAKKDGVEGLEAEFDSHDEDDDVADRLSLDEGEDEDVIDLTNPKKKTNIH